MPYAAMECLLKLSSQRYLDPGVVRYLLNVMSLFPVGSFVSLTDGSVALVLRRNGDKFSSPIVQIVEDGDGNRVDSNDERAIVNLDESELAVLQALLHPGREEIELTDEEFRFQAVR